MMDTRFFYTAAKATPLVSPKQVRPCPTCGLGIVWTGQPTKLRCAWCGGELNGK